MSAPAKRTSSLVTLELVGGLALVFLAERVFDPTGSGRKVALGVGAIVVIAAIVQRAMAWARSEGDLKRAEGALLAGSAGVVASLLLFALSTDEVAEMVGLTGPTGGKVAGALAALWPAVLAVSLTSTCFMELAYSRMPVAQAVELRRVHSAAYAGLTLALALVFLSAVNYVAFKRDEKWDLSYFKTTRPSDATLQMVRGLGQPIRIVLFWPEVNEVLAQVRPYFQELAAAAGSKLTIDVRDHALAPELARRHQVRANGQVLLLRGEGESAQSERFDVGTDLEGARSNLRTLDGRFQRAFNKLARPARNLYLTAGHGERSNVGQAGDPTGARTSMLAELLRRNNIETQPLGMAQGLANRVPDNARAVAILGPRERFIEEENRALLDYVRGGGRLVVMVDPEADHGLESLLRGLGVRTMPGTLCSETNHVRREHTPGDVAFVYSNKFSVHPTVTAASRNASEVASIFVRGGAIERHPELSQIQPTPRIAFPLRSDDDFWRDLNGNFRRDDDEPRQTLNMIAAVTVPRSGSGEEGRAVVVGDGDFVTDQVIRNYGNALVFADVLQWLLGEERITASTTTEEDIPIEHSRGEDKLWFYGTTFAAPLPLLALAWWVAGRSRRKEGA
ncbi:MAG: Gldg family protein [Deltaproteobacteria bacterium]|nr:Gldg family protein [Deltaproteobacteria bacterium]